VKLDNWLFSDFLRNPISQAHPRKYRIGFDFAIQTKGQQWENRLFHDNSEDIYGSLDHKEWWSWIVIVT
jgi:hypothetical protein